MDLLDKVEMDFASLRSSGAMAAAFHEWQERHEELSRFGDLDELMATCRGGEPADRADADSILAALCAEATARDQRAGVVLIWLLLPGLLNARARLAGVGVLSLEEVTGEMFAGLWEEVPKVTRPSRRIAARLVRAARFRAVAAMREAVAWNRRAEPLPEDIEGYVLVSDRGPPGVEPDVLSDAVREGVLSREKVELLLADRRAVREISDGLGLSIHAVQMRRDRARARLRKWAVRTYRFPTDF